jgi:Uma2 family endonuclease
MTGMASLAESSDQTVVLDNISWETYERLLADRGDSPAPRFHYDSGVLEIMWPSVSLW